MKDVPEMNQLTVSVITPTVRNS